MRNHRAFVVLALCCWMLVSVFVSPRVLGAELVTLSEANYAEYAPRGKEARAFIGDYVLRNDKITLAVADPELLMGRSASRWSIDNVAGAIIDLTLRDAQNDQLRAYYPGPMRFKPDAPGLQTELLDERLAAAKPERTPVKDKRVTLKLPAYEMTSGRPVAEMLARPVNLRGSPQPFVEVSYTLEDGWPYVLVEVTYKNPTPQPIKLNLASAIRVDGPTSAGVTPDRRLLYVYDKWWGASYGVLTEGHEIDMRRDARGVALIRFITPTGAEPTVKPDGAFTVTRRVFPSANQLETLAIASEISGKRIRRVKLEAVASDGAVASADVVIKRDGQTYGEARTGGDGILSLPLPAGEAEVTVTPYGRAPKTEKVVSGDAGTLRIECEPAARIAGEITDGDGKPIACKIEYDGIEGTSEPSFFPDTGEALVKNLCYSTTGSFSHEIPPGKYRVLVSHGPEYDPVVLTIEATAGKTTPIKAKLVRSVDTSGWISAETHNHTAISGPQNIFYVYPYSPDPLVDGSCYASPVGKVMNLIAEGIEFAPATEHNFIYDYTPIVKQLGAEKLIATCPGIGLTSGRRHTVTHQNTFPVTPRPGGQDGGALQRPEHIGQLEWLAAWDKGAPKVIQIVYPQDSKTGVGQYMDVIDVQSLLPIIEGKPIDRVASRVLDWIDRLNDGYRIPAVVNEGALSNYHGAGRSRNYVRSDAADLTAIKPLDIAKEIKAGHAMMTTGPFLRVTATSGRGEKAATAMPGDDLRAADGLVELHVSVAVNNSINLDRVQVLINGTRSEAFNFRRAKQPDAFGEGAKAFDRRIPLKLDKDAHVIVVASGDGLNLYGSREDAKGRVPHVAVSNPIWIDAGPPGYLPRTPLEDRVDATLDFLRPPVARSGAEPGLVRMFLKNSGEEPAEDSVTLQFVPPEAGRVVGEASKQYKISPRGEAYIDWEVVLTDELLDKQYPIISTYNNTGTFGIRTARSGVGVGREAAARFMEADHGIPMIGPTVSLSDAAKAIANERPFNILAAAGGSPIAQYRFGVAGTSLIVNVRVAEASLSRKPILFEGSCIELFGALPGRTRGANQAPGGYYPVRQLYLVPAVGKESAGAYQTTKDKFVPLPEVRVLSREISGGYELDALIPLTLLGIDLDHMNEEIFTGGNYVPSSVLGVAPVSGRFLLETRVNTTTPSGQRESRTLFRSASPHNDHNAFGRMRPIPPVRVRSEVVKPISLTSDHATGKVRVVLRNTGSEAIEDTLKVVPADPSPAKVIGASDRSYKLDPGQETAIEYEVALTPGRLASTVGLVAARPTSCAMLETMLTRVEVVGYKLPRIKAVDSLAKAPAALADTKAYPIVTNGQTLASLRFAIAGDDLLVIADVTDAKVKQETVLWRGSSLEVFGTQQVGARIGQVMLAPAADGKPAAAQRPGPTGKPEAAPEVRVESSATEGGYQLRALIPLQQLALDPKANTAMLELQVTTTIGNEVRRGSVFGSPRAYLHAGEYGRFEAK